MDVKRFQECNFFVRLWRRLKYQPKYFFKALYIATKVRFSPNNQYRFKFIFSLIYTEWQMKAEWHYTTEEVFGNLKREIEEAKKEIGEQDDR